VNTGYLIGLKDLSQVFFNPFTIKSIISSAGFGLINYQRGFDMKRLVIAGLLFLLACAGGSYSNTSSTEGSQPNVCAKVPIGIEAYQYMDPSVKSQKISCADLERCAALYGQGAPPNVPCE
jgi:hypothetical protein